ncbi:MAG: gfo/Idh/MocA family oxidoreductase, partial [Clostridia bacterium]|nr:gfo/Idh/MocA family oxidoreductase [Clostridia bacterium]
ERVITSKPKYGTKIPVKVDTHVAGVVRFECGALVTVMMSFDVPKHHLPPIEIYGTEGTLSVPDPNTFGGSVLLYSAADKSERELEYVSSYTENSRGIGVADTALAIEEGRPANASGALALHVLEIMEALALSAKKNRAVEITTSPGPAVPLDWSAEKGRLKTL